MAKTSIEWTDYSSGLIAAYHTETNKRGWFCVHKSEGCRNCYAATMNLRFGNKLEYQAQNRRQVRFEFAEKEAIALTKLSQRLGEKRQMAKVFPCDMTDIFLPEIGDEIRDKIFATFALCPNLVFQVLTKRPDAMQSYFAGRDGVASRTEIVASETRYLGLVWGVKGFNPYAFYQWPLPNVWLGTSIENKAALPRLDILRAIPAAMRFVSFEPLLEYLGPVNLQGISWAILGGESGPSARPCNVSWLQRLQDLCVAQNVPCFMKQLGSKPVDSMGQPMKLRDRKGAVMSEWPGDLRVRQMPEVTNSIQT